MTNWRFVHIGSENDALELGGLQAWREAWRESEEPVFLSDPHGSRQTHRLCVYEIGPTVSPIRFAAGEFSAGVWAFFIPSLDWRYRVTEVIPVEGQGKIIMLAGTTDLPAGVQVDITLKLPDGSIAKVIGLKEWALPVDGPPFKHDAFLLPSVEDDISVGTLVEIAALEPAISWDAPEPFEPPRVPTPPEPVPAEEVRSVVQPPVVIGNSCEEDNKVGGMISTETKILATIWVLYIISIAFAVYRIILLAFQLRGMMRISGYYGSSAGLDFSGPSIWLGLLLFYLFIVPAALLQFTLWRQARK